MYVRWADLKLTLQQALRIVERGGQSAVWNFISSSAPAACGDKVSCEYCTQHVPRVCSSYGFCEQANSRQRRERLKTNVLWPELRGQFPTPLPLPSRALLADVREIPCCSAGPRSMRLRPRPNVRATSCRERREESRARPAREPFAGLLVPYTLGAADRATVCN